MRIFRQRRGYKTLNITLLFILSTSMFGSSFGLLLANANDSETIIIDSFTPRLGDNRTAFIEFKNSTGHYLTEDGITTELESYVEAQWRIDYQEAYQKYQENLEREREHEDYMNTLQKATDIICSPLTIFISIFRPIFPIYLPSITLPSLTQITQPISTPINNFLAGSGAVIEDTIEKPNIDDFKPLDIKFDVGESNITHIFITDPTNQTDGYWIDKTPEYIELNSSRGQTYQHYYNVSSDEYTYNSGSLVNKTGVIDNTDWITEEEYPYNFIFRLTNGSTYFFSTPEETTSFYNSIDNSTIWGVGYESFAGVMAFYLNFADTDWGHAQYLYYPRLANGQLAPYNMPQYAIYPHLYANFGGTWYDKLLNDRSLYTQSNQNPRNTLEFFNTSDTFGIKFSTPDIDILSSNWNFVYGFKYNFTDNLFHMINEVVCNDRDFDDASMEIANIPSKLSSLLDVIKKDAEQASRPKDEQTTEE